MSNQAYSNTLQPYWLSSTGVKAVNFIKNETPPIAYLDKGILYEMNDGKLYFNGNPLSGATGAAIGDVSGPTGSKDNAVARYDTTTGKILQDSNLILQDGNSETISINGFVGSSRNLLRATDSSQKTTLGLRTPSETDLGLGSTAIGHGAMQLTTGALATNCTAIGADALYNCNGVGNVSIGAASGLQLTGTDSRNIIIDSPGVVGDNDVIRIGDSHTKCFIKGIYGSTGIGASQSVIIDATGQLSSAVTSTGLTYGTNQDGVILVYKSPTEISQSNLTFDNSTGPQFNVSGFATAIMKMIGNHSAYYGAFNGGNFSGSGNTSIGGSSMNVHSSGSNNTSLGAFSLFYKTTGSNNTSLGSSALQNITTGSTNIGIGQSSGNSYTTSESNNIVIGNSGVIGESQVIRIGDTNKTKTYLGVDFRSNNTNLRIGYQAANILDENTSVQNVIIGTLSGGSYVTNSNDTIVGYRSAINNTGNNNSIFGANSFNGAGSASSNAILGSNSAGFATTASQNVICGMGNAPSLTTGNSNIILGYSVGGTLTTGSNNILIGANASVNSEANTTRIGIAGTQTRTFISGISGVTTGGAAVTCLVDANGQLGTISSSREVKENIRDVEDTSFLYNLNVKNFEYINGTCCDDPTDPHYGLKQKHIGVIAEEVELIKPELVIMQQNGVKTVDYQYLFMSTIKELQKLKLEVDALKTI